jgi:hypothetical protein
MGRMLPANKRFHGCGAAVRERCLGLVVQHELPIIDRVS